MLKAKPKAAHELPVACRVWIFRVNGQTHLWSFIRLGSAWGGARQAFHTPRSHPIFPWSERHVLSPSLRTPFSGTIYATVKTPYVTVCVCCGDGSLQLNRNQPQKVVFVVERQLRSIGEVCRFFLGELMLIAAGMFFSPTGSRLAAQPSMKKWHPFRPLKQSMDRAGCRC